MAPHLGAIALVWVLAAGFIGATPVSAAKPETGPALWKLADEDTTIYLFGTVHILQKSVDWRTDAFDTAWDASPTVYLEADAKAAEGPQTQALVRELGLNPPGTSLSSFLDPEERTLFAGTAVSIGLPTSVLEPYRPWLAGVVFGVQWLVGQGGDPEAGVDTILAAEARAKGKTLRFFETPQEQLRILAGIPDPVSADSFVSGLQAVKDNPNLFQDIVDRWLAGDLEGQTALLDMAENEPEEVFEAVFARRNEAWVKELIRVLAEDQGTVFVAVGMGHLIGERSVNDLLTGQGVALERVQ
ncbi:MAG: TraB/GumN family protein [Alphaproteobacteria bacterium]